MRLQFYYQKFITNKINGYLLQNQQKDLTVNNKNQLIQSNSKKEPNKARQMGKKIENYILQTAVGAGEFGKVYKAYNQKTNQIVAVKVIQIQKFRSSPKLQQFTINEINTLSKIQDSTHIVRFIEILKTANNYYFVYEFCNQGTLEERIKAQGRFTEQKALQYFNELLKAFKMLVKNNIMHRDIKPSNILLNNGVIKLADFGFCKPMKDSKDLAQTMLGSPIYMAPQILKGEIYTMKADIWSLGVVLYEMLYGFCPFEERSIARLINLIDEGTVTFPSTVKISKNTEDLIKRMLVKDQFKRIQWRELFEYNLYPPKETISNNVLNYENSRHSISYMEEQKNQRLNSTTKKQNLNGINNNNLPQQSPQQLISNPFTKKHFQSVNPNVQVNDFSNHQNSTNTSLQERQKQRERRYMDQVKQDYSNRNASNNKKYLNHGSSVYQNTDRITSEKDKFILQDLQRKRSNTVHDIRQAANSNEKENILQYQTNSNNIMQNIVINPQLTMKKTKSTPSISDIEKKIIQNILEKRQKILKGIKMIEKFLSQSSSKTNVHVCCFIAKRVKLLAIETEQTIKKSLKERQSKSKEKENFLNSSSNVEIDKAIGSIQQQIKQIKIKLQPFEQQFSQIHEPQDIIFLRYGEEENLTQEKEGLSQLLMIDDFLNISVASRCMNSQTPQPNSPLTNISNQSNNQANRTPLAPIGKQTPSSSVLYSLQQNYQMRTKKELLEEYERRVLRNI